ncbi:MAG: exo-alpha-sialidase [Clostridia bacterium]|nr:exo-alpha-sialidase [Clostridia bacterium]
MKITQIGTPEIVMHNPDSRHNYFGWPTATRLQNGKIAVVASGFRLNHVCPFGKTVISYSEDEGKTYTMPAPVIDTALDDRDGGILAFGKSGVIVTSFNNTRGAQRNWAKGWAVKMNVKEYVDSYLDIVSDEEEERYLGSTFRISNDCGVTFGDIQKCPVTSPHGPCELPDGSLLWVGRMFSGNDAKKDGESVKAYKVNTDGTCELVGGIENIEIGGVEMLSCEPHAFPLDDGTILCHIRVQGSGKDSTVSNVFTTYQSVSNDSGRTWSKPEPLLSLRGGAPAHIMKHSSGVLISVYGYRDAPFGVKAMFSKDGGKTWDIDHDVYINGISADLGYPSTVELSDGSLLTVFYAIPEKGKPAIIMQQRWKFEL